MSLIADGILILTCLTTAIYCYVLSRRLSRLSNTDEGIGKQIAQMNAGLEETRAALREIRATSKVASEELSREVARAQKVSAQLSKRADNAAVVAAAAASPQPRYDPEPVEEPSPPPAAAEPAAAVPQMEEKVPALDIPDVPELVDETPEFDPLELDDDAAADMDAADAAFIPDGQQQLGFLPQVDVLDQVDEDMKLGSGRDVGDDDDDLTDLTKDDPGPPPEQGVLKVERMAL